MFSGAGGQHSWRRWFFGGETCAVNRGSVRCTGAGPHPFSSPAPKHPYTCANGWYNLNWFHHLTNQVEGEGRLRERNARIRHRRIGAKKAPEAPFPQPFHYTNPLRQVAAQEHPLEGHTRPLNVRQGPISACGAPQPPAQRAERGFPCGCLAEHRVVWRNPGQISPLAPLGRNDKGPGSAEMTRGDSRSSRE